MAKMKGNKRLSKSRKPWPCHSDHYVARPVDRLGYPDLMLLEINIATYHQDGDEHGICHECTPFSDAGGHRLKLREVDEVL